MHPIIRAGSGESSSSQNYLQVRMTVKTKDSDPIHLEQLQNRLRCSAPPDTKDGTVHLWGG